MPALKVGIDPPKIRCHDAAKIMAHHLSLAAAYYEATPDTQVQVLSELADVFGEDHIALSAARQFYQVLVSSYDALDQGDAT